MSAFIIKLILFARLLAVLLDRGGLIVIISFLL